MVVSYRLEAEAIAVNAQRANFVLLTEKVLDGCSKPMIGFCSVKSPVHPISLDRSCITAMFIKKKERIEQHCQTVVKLDAVLPMAEYLTDGNRIITAQRKLKPGHCPSPDFEGGGSDILPPVPIRRE